MIKNNVLDLDMHPGYIYIYTNRYGIVSARCFFKYVALRHVTWHYCIIIMPCHFFKHKFIGRFDTHTQAQHVHTHTQHAYTRKHIYVYVYVCVYVNVYVYVYVYGVYMFDVLCILYNVYIYIHTCTPFGNQRWQWKIQRQDRCGTEASPSES